MDRVDWSKLQEDLLLLIFQWLPISDLLRSAAVCSSWSFVTRDLRRRHRHFSHARQAPWLLLSGEYNDGIASPPNSAAKFYDPLENRFYTIPLRDPSVLDGIRQRIGSSHGWLTVADDLSQLHLLNPITGEQIELPSPKSFDHSSTSNDLRCLSYKKAFLSTSPSKGNYALVVIHGPRHWLAVARAGDHKWTTLSDKSYHDGVVVGDKLYAVCWNGVIEVWELNGTEVSAVNVLLPKPPRTAMASTFYKYLVSHPSGDVLQVWREVDLFDLSVKFSVFRIDLVRKDRMVEVESLGDYALFVSMSNSICIPCKDSHGARANCIYFVENELRMNNRAIGVYSLEDRSLAPAAHAFDDGGWSWKWATWFTPSLV